MFKEYVLDAFLLIERFSEKNAFCINEQFYSYNEFAKHISKIRKVLQSNIVTSKQAGLVANDDIEIYVAIFARRLEGIACVPIHLSNQDHQ